MSRTTPPFLHPFARPARTDFIHLVRGEGAYVFDAEGKAYLDGLAGLWFCQIGHGRASMADAIRDQVATLAAFHNFEPFVTGPVDALAARVVALTGLEGARVALSSGGSDAVDTAIKLVRHAHQRRGDVARTGIVRLEHAYHGVTLGGTSAQGIPANREGFGPLVPDFHEVSDVASLEALFEARGATLAAVFVEPVRGAGGVHPVPDAFLRRARELTRAHGALLVFDEVITGFGRLGTWFGAQAVGVVPDAIVFAKGVTSGYLPLGGVVLGAALVEALEAPPDVLLRHGHTYSGHAAACAAALENLRILEAEALVPRAAEVGRRLADGLGALLARGRVASLRGRAAIAAVDLPPGSDAFAVRDRMIARGVIPRAVGPRSLAFCPPLVIDLGDVDRMVEALDACL